MRKLSRRYKLLVLGAFLVLITLLFIPLQRALYFYTDQYVHQILTEMVEEESNGEYYVKYQSLKFNIFSQKLKLFDFHLYPKDTLNLVIDTNASKNKFYYGVSIDEFHLELEKEWEIFLSNKLLVKNARFIKPHVKVLNQRVEKKMQYDLGNISGELYKAVTSYLSAFKLRNVDLVDTKMDYYLQTSEFSRVLRFNDFSVRIRDLDIEEGHKLRREKILFADDFELTSKKQQFYLEDSSHFVSFDRFHVSVRNRVLSFDNIRVTPIILDSLHPKTNLTLFSPKIDLQNIDFEKFYQKNELDITDLLLDRPVAKFDLHLRNDSQADSNQNKLRFFDILNKTKIDKIRLSRGSLTFRRIGAQKTDNYVADGISFRVHKFYLDSNVIEEGNYYQTHKNFRFRISELSHEIPEEGLLLSANNLEYSSITKVLDCGKVRVKPNVKNKQIILEQTARPWHLEYLEIEGVHGTGLDFERVEKTGNVQLGSVSLDKPTLQMSWDSTYHSSIDTANMNKSYVLPIVDTLFVNRLKVLDADIEVIDARAPDVVYGSAKEVNIWMNEFSNGNLSNPMDKLVGVLNSSSVETGPTELALPNTKFDFSWDEMFYSSTKRTFQTNGLQYFKSDSESDFSLEVESFLATDIRPDEVVKKATFSAAGVFANRPVVRIKRRSSNKSNEHWKSPLRMLDFDTIAIVKGLFYNSLNDTVLQELSGVDIHAGRLSWSDSLRNTFDFQSMSVSNEHGKVLVDQGRHQLHFSGISYSDIDSVFSFEKLALNPVIDAQRIDGGTIVKGFLKHGTFTGFWSGRKPFGEFLQFRTGVICELESYVSTEVGTKVAPQKEDYLTAHRAILQKTGLKFARFDSLRIEKGLLNASWQDQSKGLWRFDLPQYQLQVNKFSVDPTSSMTDERLVHAKDISMVAYGVSQEFPDSLDNFNSSYMEMSTSRKELLMRDIEFSQMLKDVDGEKKLFVEGRLNEISLKGFKPILFDKKRLIDLDRLYLKGPNLEFTQFHRDDRTVSRELTLQMNNSDDSSALHSVIIRQFGLEEGNLIWDFNDSISDPIRIRHLNIDGSELTKQTKENPTYNSLELSFGNFEYEVLKGFYQLSVDSFNYSHKNQRLQVLNLRMDPNYGIFDFAREAGWEKTRLEIFNQKLVLDGFDLNDYLNTQRIEARSLTADSLWVRTFKDKNLPMKNRYMPMPQEHLRNIPFGVKIDTAYLRRGFVQHNQLSKRGVRAGKIEFTGLKADLTNITNDSASLEKNSNMFLSAKGRLMGGGAISAQFNFDLNNPRSTFTGEAQLGAFDARLLNEFTEHVAFVRIKSGNVKSGLLEFDANKEYGVGFSRVLYDDMHLDFLNSQDPDKEGRELALKSFLANRVVNTKNPHFFITKKGDVFAYRDSARAIFHYWGRLGMSGVVTSMGVRNNQIKKLKKEQIRKEAAIRREEEEELKRSLREKKDKR